MRGSLLQAGHNADVLLLRLPLALALDPPELDHSRGLVDEPFTLDIRSPDAADLLYSLDGGTPDQAYEGPLSIDQTTVVRAQAQLDGELSTVTTHTFLFLDDVMQQSALDAGITQDPELGPRMRASLETLPSVSLALDGDVSTAESGLSFEYFEPGGQDLQQDCGGARVGGHSLGYAKNNLRLYFRSDYGKGQLDADFFGEDYRGLPPLQHHDSLDLRGGSHDSGFYLGTRGQHLRNIWMDETELAMGHEAPHGRFVHLYLNGEYTGLYQLRERFDAAMLAEHRGGSEDDYEAVNGGRAVDGSGAAWARIDASVDDFETFRQWVNVEQYLDYMVLNLFAANTWDWNPYQNWMAAGPLTPTSGWVFHSSDSDICLYYSPDTWMLDRSGPAYSWTGLLSEGHPDFQVALMDALHRNLRAEGALTWPGTSDRYSSLASQIEDAVVAEAARWGYGAWDPELHWATERDYLVEEWFPARLDELLDDVEGAGWLPLPAPELSQPPGVVQPASELRISVPEEAGDLELWIALDGQDPRLDGGEVAPDALEVSPSRSFTLDRGLQVTARLRQGETWGPRVGGLYELDEAPALILNEWNAVSPEQRLSGEDQVFGQIEGNGGDWIELLILEETDLRGARLEWSDASGSGTVTLPDEPVLASLPPGVLLTVAAELPQHLDLDPEGGDWRLHLQVPELEVSESRWQLSVWAEDGALLMGPVGEGRSPVQGISASEVGMLAATPSGELRTDSEGFRDADDSSFGAPNSWDGGAQDLNDLRGLPSDSGSWGDTRDSPAPPAGPAADCGCSSTPSPGWLLALLPLVFLRRRRLAALPLLAGCSAGIDSSPAEESPTPDTSSACRPQPEVCNDLDDDCDGLVDEDDPDLADGLPFYEDLDGDGFGGEVVLACRLEPGRVLLGGDCDESDPEIHPGAVELCDDIDQDCDGQSGDALGLTEDCSAESCLQILEEDELAADGAYWLGLPSGTVAQVACDMSGGGWTLGFSRNTASTGSQGDFGLGEVGVDGLVLSPAEASASSTPVLAWLDLNDLDYLELQLGAYAGGVESYRSEAIPRSELRLAFGDDGYYLYGGTSPYVWCGGDRTYTDSGTGAVNNPSGATADCRGHGSLGSGWDFSESHSPNQGLTLCGSDGSNFLASTWGGGWITYGQVGGAQAIWVR